MILNSMKDYTEIPLSTGQMTDVSWNFGCEFFVADGLSAVWHRSKSQRA